MENYSSPNIEMIFKELKRAGANENQQIAGSLWIPSALMGAGRKSTPAKTADTRKQIEKNVQKALANFEKLDPLYQDWLKDKIQNPLKEVEKYLIMVSTVQPGGHREKAHRIFAEALKRFFESAGLNITLTTESPFVSIFASCVNLDNDAARVTLNRFFKQEQIS